MIRHFEPSIQIDNCKNKSFALLIEKPHYVHKKTETVFGELFVQQQHDITQTLSYIWFVTSSLAM